MINQLFAPTSDEQRLDQELHNQRARALNPPLQEVYNPDQASSSNIPYASSPWEGYTHTTTYSPEPTWRTSNARPYPAEWYEDNPAAQALQRETAQQTAQSGPIRFAPPSPEAYNDSSYYRPCTELNDEVIKWKREIGYLEFSNWSQYGSNPNARSFGTFLGRLREITAYKNEETRAEFTHRVGSLLLHLQDNPAIRDTCFTMADDTITSCGDRVALGFLDMESLCFNHKLTQQAKQGDFDAQPQRLINICKSIYRLNIICAAAEEKTHNAHATGLDAVEVRLGLLVVFSREFDLPTSMNTQLYASYSKIRASDLINIRKQLTNRPWDKKTKELYMDTTGHIESFERHILKESKIRQTSTSEKKANRNKFVNFLEQSPAIMSWLERAYSHNLQAQVEALIEQKKEALNTQMEELDNNLGNLSEHQYNTQAKELQKRFEDIEADAKADVLRDVLDTALMEHGLDVDLSDPPKVNAFESNHTTSFSHKSNPMRHMKSLGKSLLRSLNIR